MQARDKSVASGSSASRRCYDTRWKAQESMLDMYATKPTMIVSPIAEYLPPARPAPMPEQDIEVWTPARAAFALLRLARETLRAASKPLNAERKI